MKNNLKKCLALLVAMVMVLAMATSVFAATNNNTNGERTNVGIAENAPTVGTLTIENQTSDATYTAYPVFTASVNTGDNTYTWTPVEAFEDVLRTKDALTAEKVASMDAAKLKELAAALAAATTKPVAATNLSSLALGYYLVVETGTTGLSASQPILVAVPQVQEDEWVYNITVAPKSSSTDFTKKIAEDNKLVDTNTKNIGDYVDYRLWADVPTYAAAAYDSANIPLTFEITDKMSKELTWGSESEVNVYVVDEYTEANIVDIATSGEKLTVGTDYTIDPSVTENTKGGTFTVKFTKNFLKKNAGKVAVVTFKAQLNENAIIADATGEDIEGYTTGLKDQNYNKKGNPNAAKLTYTNEFDAKENSGTDEKKDIVTTFTFKLDVEKVDKGNSNTKLEGAEFEVYTDETCSPDNKYANTKFTEGKLVTVGETGSATGEGFDAGTYYLKETKAPTGYKLYDGKIKVEIVKLTDTNSNEYNGQFTYTVTMMPNGGTAGTPAEGVTKVTVEDEKGTTLPGTGGIGTTIFTFGGLALVVLAAALFIVYMKKQKKQA